MIITREALQQLCPRPSTAGPKQAIWDGYAGAIASEEGNALLAHFEITAGANQHKRWPQFASTFAHECEGLTLLWESGAYQAPRILEIFGQGAHSAGVTPAEARNLAGNGPALFDRVYGIADPKCCGRVKACTKLDKVRVCKARELGNGERGDGWRFRGLGPGQTTGGDAHRGFAAAIGCTLEQLAEPINTLKAMLLEWQKSGMNALADLDNAEAVCRKWNGGLNGIEDRKAKLARAKKIWAPEAPVAQLLGQVASGELVREPLQLGAWDVALNIDGRNIEGPISEAQRKLAAAGFYGGAVDGEYMALTQRAVAGFQVAHGLIASGAIDEPTSRMLDEVAADPPAAVPGREHIDAAALLARGSNTVGAARALIVRVLGLIVAGGVALVDGLLNLDLIEAAITAGESAKLLAGRMSTLLLPFMSAKVIGGLALLIVAASMSRLAKRIIGERVKLAKKGA